MAMVKKKIKYIDQNEELSTCVYSFFFRQFILSKLQNTGENREVKAT